MIKGSSKVLLTTDSVLARISPFDIFTYYMPNKWKINETTYSPFRKEKNPSFSINNRLGNLCFIDFTNTTYKGDCFTFVKMLFNLSSMDEVLKMIDKDFNLGISNRKLGQEYKIITQKYEQPDIADKKHTLIQVSTRAFTNEELAYWNQYHQDISDLRREHVYSIDKVYLNKRLFVLKDTELRFGYFYDGHWKIYRPYAAKAFKWVPNNVAITQMDGKKNIIGAENAFINKSKKDYMVIKKIYPQTCAVQNEGMACFSPENVKFLKENSKKQTLSFDSDIPGVTSSLDVTKAFGFEYCNVPREYLQEGIKDWAELAKIHKMSEVEKVLIQKGII